MRRIFRVFPAHHRESTTGGVQGVLFINNFQKQGGNLASHFSIFRYNLFVGFASRMQRGLKRNANRR